MLTSVEVTAVHEMVLLLSVGLSSQNVARPILTARKSKHLARRQCGSSGQLSLRPSAGREWSIVVYARRGSGAANRGGAMYASCTAES